MNHNKEKRVYVKIDLMKTPLDSLEDLLDTKQEELLRLRKLKKTGRLRTDENIDLDDLPWYLDTIKYKVDQFLGVSGIITPKIKGYNGRIRRTAALSMCSLAMGSVGVILPAEFSFTTCAIGVTIGYFAGHITTKYLDNVNNQYDRKTALITVETKKKIRVLPIIAHEYAHHVQKYSAWPLISDAVDEGHARGVQRYISRLLAIEHDNDGFLLPITDTTYGELKSAYHHVCKARKKQPNKHLTGTRSERDLDELLNRLIYKKPTEHATGNLLFCLCERENGTGFYKMSN